MAPYVTVCCRPQPRWLPVVVLPEKVCAVSLMVLGVYSTNTLLNAATFDDITLHCLCVRSTDRDNECRSHNYACSPHNHKWTYTHSIVLLVLEAHRKYCVITSCSTLSSQSHNMYFHFVHKFIHDLAPTLVLLQCEGVRCDITTAHLGKHHA